jgi:two-component system NtrC family response regulator
VLESGEIRRVGENKSTTVDVRIVAATHRDLPTMVAAEEFREDLMYRINTFEIYLPPLRERIDDVPDLARHLLARQRRGVKGAAEDLADDAVAALVQHVWPGNVRELANVIEHATILCDAGPIRNEHLPQHFATRQLQGAARQRRGVITLRELEIEAIHEALERNDGNKPKSADELGVSLKTLYNKLNAESELEKSA